MNRFVVVLKTFSEIIAVSTENGCLIDYEGSLFFYRVEVVHYFSACFVSMEKITCWQYYFSIRKVQVWKYLDGLWNVECKIYIKKKLPWAFSWSAGFVFRILCSKFEEYFIRNSIESGTTCTLGLFNYIQSFIPWIIRCWISKTKENISYRIIF